MPHFVSPNGLRSYFLTITPLEGATNKERSSEAKSVPGDKLRWRVLHKIDEQTGVWSKLDVYICVYVFVP